jgi:Heparinase II/III-like protein/Heparinase II/III N-terminus
MGLFRRSEISTLGEFEVEAFRAGRLERPLSQYEALLSSDRWADRFLDEVELTLTEGWKRGGLPRVLVQPPVAWAELCASNRSWQFHLQAWEPMSLVLSAHQHLGEQRYIDYCLGLALDWIGQYPSPSVDGDFAWYDMAIGLRAYRLGYLLDVVSRDPEVDDESIAALAHAAVVHSQALAPEEGFRGHNNHGLYQAAGQVALARRFPELPTMGEALEQGQERLGRMVRAQFAEDGVHREHSPGYHYLLLDTLERLLACDLIEQAEIRELAGRAEEVLAWFSMPNRRIPMIGDTSVRILHHEPFATSANDALRFVATGGESGSPPENRLQAYPTSGYVVMRDRWPEGPDDFADCSYLIQIAAFHSYAHKHADDFSFVWYDRGMELVADSGRYGYLGQTEPKSELARQGFMYSDPNRVYVETTRAHNTVEIDGLSHPRRNVEPYGSGLVGWGEQGELMWSECCARFHETVEHRRLLVFRPGHWLVVVDALQDVEGDSHDYSQRFHFAPELTGTEHGARVELELPKRSDRLHLLPLVKADRAPLVVGQREPELLGFVSRGAYEMLPAATTAYLTGGVPEATFATLLLLGEETPEADTGGNRLSRDGLEGELTWRTGAVRHELSFERRGDDAGLRYLEVED